MKELLTAKESNHLVPGAWKPVYWAAAVYVALVPIAYFLGIIAPGRKDWQLWSFTAVTHALLCALVAATSKVIVLIVEHWMPRSRLRPYTGHIRNFIGVLAVWPFCIAVFMVIWKLKHP